MRPVTSETGAASPQRRRPAKAAIGGLLRAVPQLRPVVEELLWRGFYELASLGAGGAATTLMNYGYAAEGASGSEEQVGDFGLALYGAVAGAAELTGREVLEVGCGRGGGSAFVFERFGPSSLHGLDVARTAIGRCRHHHARPGLTFLTGDAQDLPFPSARFDVVINVESSHCYPDMATFLAEVTRVLRPGGLLLLADFRPTDPTSLGGPPREDVRALRRQFEQAGLEPLEEQDITAEVIRALSLATPALRSRVARRVPRPLRRMALEFSAIEGSTMFRTFAEGKRTYLRFVLQRP